MPESRLVRHLGLFLPAWLIAMISPCVLAFAFDSLSPASSHGSIVASRSLLVFLAAVLSAFLPWVASIFILEKARDRETFLVYLLLSFLVVHSCCGTGGLIQEALRGGF
jgi:hypothetical protein